MCRTCEGTGKITETVDEKYTTRRVKITGIHNLHSGGWHNIDYSVEYDDGTIGYVEGRRLKKDVNG